MKPCVELVVLKKSPECLQNGLHLVSTSHSRRRNAEKCPGPVNRVLEREHLGGEPELEIHARHQLFRLQKCAEKRTETTMNRAWTACQLTELPVNRIHDIMPWEPCRAGQCASRPPNRHPSAFGSPPICYWPARYVATHTGHIFSITYLSCNIFRTTAAPFGSFSKMP